MVATAWSFGIGWTLSVLFRKSRADRIVEQAFLKMMQRIDRFDEKSKALGLLKFGLRQKKRPRAYCDDRIIIYVNNLYLLILQETHVSPVHNVY